MGNPVRQDEAHPISNLLGEIDVLEVEIRGGNETSRVLPMADDIKAHLKDLLMSAYATGVRKGSK